METPTERSEDGQALVWVGVLMVVLILAVALAVDMGNVLQRRRGMQNAADAGALAGAHSICYGPFGRTQEQIEADAEEAAETYAIANGVKDEDGDGDGHQDWVDVSFPLDWKVAVTATEETPTFLLGIIGMDTLDVGAVAEAGCGSAVDLCNVFPLTFHWERWNTPGFTCSDTWDPENPNEDDLDPDSIFYVFNDDRFESEDCWFSNDEPPDCPKICDVCNCSMIPPDQHVFVIDAGDRGWVNFPRPGPEWPDPPSQTDNCGAVQTVAWVAAGGYTGMVSIFPLDGGDLCLPSQDGVANAIRHEIEDHIYDTPNILLWDRACTEDEPVTGECPGAPYHVIATGCVVILAVEVVALEPMPGYDPNDCATLNHVKTIKAAKLCECDSECGSTIGGPPVPGQVNSVSLLR